MRIQQWHAHEKSSVEYKANSEGEELPDGVDKGGKIFMKKDIRDRAALRIYSLEDLEKVK